MGLNIHEVIRVHFNANRVIQLDDGVTHTPDLIEMTDTFGMLGAEWRTVKVADVVYFARVMEAGND